MEYVDLIFALVYLLLGVILYPGNQCYIVTSACGQTVMLPACPPGSAPLHEFIQAKQVSPKVEEEHRFLQQCPTQTI